MSGLCFSGIDCSKDVSAPSSCCSWLRLITSNFDVSCLACCVSWRSTRAFRLGSFRGEALLPLKALLAAALLLCCDQVLGFRISAIVRLTECLGLLPHSVKLQFSVLFLNSLEDSLVHCIPFAAVYDGSSGWQLSLRACNWADC